MPNDPFDVNLEDESLLEEVELVTTVMVASHDFDEHLTQDQIDKVLGVVPRPRAGD